MQAENPPPPFTFLMVRPLQRGDTVRVKPFQLGRQEWQKGIVRGPLDERSHEVETPQSNVRRNRVHLRKTNEPPPPSPPSPPSPDMEVPDEVLPAVSAEVDVPTLNGEVLKVRLQADRSFSQPQQGLCPSQC